MQVFFLFYAKLLLKFLFFCLLNIVKSSKKTFLKTLQEEFYGNGDIF